MPKGIAVTRMVESSFQFNPPSTSLVGMNGVGNEKPNVEKEALRFSALIPPMGWPMAVDPHAMSEPAAIATNPAGIFPYFTPPNQLAKIIAKQTTPIAGVIYICRAGDIEMNVIDTPASAPSNAALGV